ncbi:MAG: DUF6492 family protein [Halioglobus sp.]
MKTNSSEKMEMITCSYGPDFERCKRLCESVDRFVAQEIGHTLIVPARDLSHFLPLATSRRRVVTAQDILGNHFRQIPWTNRWWVDKAGWPVRGWILQQLLKLSADKATDAELLIFADSDLQFVRPFDKRHVIRDGKLRLHRVPGAMNEGRHARWHHRAGALFGEPKEYFGSDYVGQLITWRRSELIALQQRITRTQGKPWLVSVSRTLDFSEYILYGSFVEHVSVSGRDSHYFDHDELCHCCWVSEQADGVLSGESALQPSAVALLIQSNLGLAPDQEAKILHAAIQGTNIQGANIQGANIQTAGYSL